MNDLVEILRDFATSTTGRVVLIGVALVVLLVILMPLWRSMKYLLKALLWALLVILVLTLGAVAIWVWVKREAKDPARMEAVERKAYDTLRSGWTNDPEEGGPSSDEN